MTTTPPKLRAIDFMMMDVHEPLTSEEIDTINPQAAVDKSAGAVEDVVGNGEGVGGAPPRCEMCFGPMPCTDHANVEQLDAITSLDISPTAVLAGAHNADLEFVVVVGMNKDGSEYFASSVSDAAESMYYLQRGIHQLNKIADNEEHESRDGPSAA